MQEDWRDEAEPLVWLRRLRAVSEGRHTHAEAAEVVEGAETGGRRDEGCRVRAAPSHLCAAEVGAIDDVCAHAGNETSAHVDQDVWRGTDHGIEGGMDFNWRSSEGG